MGECFLQSDIVSVAVDIQTCHRADSGGVSNRVGKLCLVGAAEQVVFELRLPLLQFDCVHAATTWA